MSRIDPGKTGLPPVLYRVAAALAAMMVLSYLFTLLFTRRLGSYPPYGFFFFQGEFWALDFKTFHDQSIHFGSPTFWADYGYPFTYPAFTALVYATFYHFQHSLRVYFAVLILGGTAWLIWFWRRLIGAGADPATTVAFGLICVLGFYPIFYEYDTGNVEGLMAIALGLGVLAILYKRPMLGAGLIGIAISMKMYPFILLGLLFSRRKYRAFAFALAVAVALNYLSLWLMGPSISVAQTNIKIGIGFVKETFMVPTRPVALTYSHALFNPIKYLVTLVYRLIHHNYTWVQSQAERVLIRRTLKLYMAAMVVTGLTLYFGRIRRLPMLNQVLALTTASIVLTPFSSDYTLIHLLVPFTLLCCYAIERWRSGQIVPGLNWYFGFLTAAVGFGTFCTWVNSYHDFMRCFALIGLLITALRYPLPWAQLDNADAPDPTSQQQLA
jgi:hypothetical protein